MFIGLMNSIDRWILTVYEKKLQNAKNDLEQAKKDRAQLERAHAVLLLGKAAHATGDVARYKTGWIDLRQAEVLKRKANGPEARLEHSEYESWGTACAKVRKRISARASKVREHPFGSRIA